MEEHYGEGGLLFFFVNHFLQGFLLKIDAGKVLHKGCPSQYTIVLYTFPLLHSFVNISGISNDCGNISLQLFSNSEIGRGWFYKVHKLNGALLP